MEDEKYDERLINSKVADFENVKNSSCSDVSPKVHFSLIWKDLHYSINNNI